MNRPQTQFSRLLLVTISLSTGVLLGGPAFPQTQAGDAPEPSSTVQEEPGTSKDQGEVIERGIMRRGVEREKPRVSIPAHSEQHSGTKLQ